MHYAKRTKHPPSLQIVLNINHQHLVERQRNWTLTTLWRRCCTARSRWRRFGSSDTRRVCTSCTGWRKRSGCSWAPGTCRRCAGGICHCRVWRLSSSHPAALSSTFWPQKKKKKTDRQKAGQPWLRDTKPCKCRFVFQLLQVKREIKLRNSEASLSPHAPLLGLSQFLVPPQHLQDQLLLVLGQEAQVDSLCSLRHGAWKQEPLAWVTHVQRSSQSFVDKLNILYQSYMLALNVQNCHKMWSNPKALICPSEAK